MRIVDGHCHVGRVEEHYDEQFLKEMSVLVDHDSEDLNFNIDHFLGRMDYGGVEKAIILAEDFERTLKVKVPNEYIASLVRDHPDRFIGFASVDPILGKEAVEGLEMAIKDLGLRGLKLGPTYQSFSPDDESAYPVYEKVVELDIPILIHQSWTPVVKAPMKYQHPYLLDDVGINFPELKMVVAHFGWPYTDECICLVAKHRNFHIDFSFWDLFPLETLYEALMKAKNLVGFDRIMWGTDFPLTDPGDFALKFLKINEVAEKVGGEPLSDEEIENIMGMNYLRLLGLE